MTALVPDDVRGRVLVTLGTLRKIDLTATGIFLPIFTCSDITNPARGSKKTVVAFIGMDNFTAAPVSGSVSIGSSPLAVDWMGSSSNNAAAANTFPFLFAMPAPPTLLGAGGYAPGTVFGIIVTVAGTGTADATCYGWSE